MTTQNQNIAEAGSGELDSRLKPLIEAGVFYGKKKSKMHPKMRPFILQSRNGIEIINLNKTIEQADAAMAFLANKVATNATILLVATQPSTEGLVDSIATNFQYPFVNRRWIGGTITNFSIISKRIEYMKKLRRDFEKGAFDKYTKKERVMIERELRRLNELIGGLENLTKIPDVVVVIDSKLHNACIQEARQNKIPVIALTNVDANPELIQYPVLGNTNGRSSVAWFMDNVRQVIEKARMKAAADKVSAAQASEKAATPAS